MSAPQIPNLLTLRGRGGSRTRAVARGRGGFSRPSHSARETHDTTIRGTDTDASVSRASAVDLDYLEDPYAQFFVSHISGPPARRLPIINRGTYTRTKALDRLVDAFLSESAGAGNHGRRQIISLGAGTDTRPFRLFSRLQTKELVYHELDFPETAIKKRSIVHSVPALRQIVPFSDSGGAFKGSNDGNWHTQQLPRGCEYWSHGIDLRDLLTPEPPASVSETADSSPEQVPSPMKAPLSQASRKLPGILSDVPTLLISECCLCYLGPSEAAGVISYFTSQLPNLSIILYEPIRPDDPFGRQMVANLAARNIVMPTLDVYRDVADQRRRLESAGFKAGTRAITVRDVWKQWVSEDEKERVDRLEGLDEVEEWDLLAGHYVVAWAWKGQGFESWNGI